MTKLKEKKIATFRVEASCDLDRARTLLKFLNIEHTERMSEYSATYFTIECHDIDSTRELLKSHIEADYPHNTPHEYVDLHRVYQTLCIGDTPKEPYD